MNYQQKDFDFCQFNPLVSGKMLEAYPKLLEIIEPDWIDADVDALLRFIIMVYDPKSPLIANEKDINYRKGVAGELAGMDDPDILETICTATHAYSSDLTIKYLMRFAKSKEWAAICAFESSFWESIKEVMKPISGKNSKEVLDSVQKKSAIKEEIEKDILRLDKLYRTFFGDDDDLQNRTKRRLTPELMAVRNI